ncbi:MAG: hypothetical protein AAGU11_16965, partial [Syntrophobacteraceae bacterium]
MRLICPCCGGIASLEAWCNDAEIREFQAAMARMPAIVQSKIPQYLGLFRKEAGRALAWPKASKLLGQLASMIDDGVIQWEGGERRPSPPQLWAEAIDAVIERRPKGLGNHNYLRHVVWEKAGPLAAQAERRQESHAPVRYFEPEQSVPRKRTCYICTHFKPPKFCAAASKATADNLMLGCSKWEEKAASVGDLTGTLADGLRKITIGDDGQ